MRRIILRLALLLLVTALLVSLGTPNTTAAAQPVDQRAVAQLSTPSSSAIKTLPTRASSLPGSSLVLARARRPSLRQRRERPLIETHRLCSNSTAIPPVPEVLRTGTEGTSGSCGLANQIYNSSYEVTLSGLPAQPQPPR